jgi:hypothetical protein
MNSLIGGKTKKSKITKKKSNNNDISPLSPLSTISLLSSSFSSSDEMQLIKEIGAKKTKKSGKVKREKKVEKEIGKGYTEELVNSEEIKKSRKIGREKKVEKKEKVEEILVEDEEKINIEDDKNMPIIVELKKIESNILDYDADIKFSTNIDYPRGEYGFHHYVHSNKSKLEQLNMFEGKKKIYLVFNRFENNIDNYDETITETSKKFFKDKQEIVDKNFYKLWEMLLMFNLINIEDDKFNSLHIGETDKSFTQATTYFRELFCKKELLKNDKYYCVNSNDLNNKFANSKIEVINTDKISNKSSFITIDCNIAFSNENTQEQDYFKIVIPNIITALKSQKKNGNLVCKIFETFTKTSLKLISILSSSFEKVYFVKPLTSRLIDSEKYIICMNFNDKNTKKMDDLLKKLNNKNKLVDIFTEYEIPTSIIPTIIEINKRLSNKQLESIGKTMAFISKEIYSGDEYHEKNAEQIEGTKYWTSMFLSDSLNKNKLNKIVKSSLKYSNEEIDKLTKLLTY